MGFFIVHGGLRFLIEKKFFEIIVEYSIAEIDWHKVLEDCFHEVEVEDSKVEEIINDLFAG